MTESDLQASIMSALRSCGFWVIRTGVTKKRSRSHGTNSGEPGMPDLYLPGFGHIEVKLPNEDLSDEQRAWHDRAKRNNVRVAVVTSVEQALRLGISWRTP